MQHSAQKQHVEFVHFANWTGCTPSCIILTINRRARCPRREGHKHREGGPGGCRIPGAEDRQKKSGDRVRGHPPGAAVGQPRETSRQGPAAPHKYGSAEPGNRPGGETGKRNGTGGTGARGKADGLDRVQWASPPARACTLTTEQQRRPLPDAGGPRQNGNNKHRASAFIAAAPVKCRVTR